MWYRNEAYSYIRRHQSYIRCKYSRTRNPMSEDSREEYWSWFMNRQEIAKTLISTHSNEQNCESKSLMVAYNTFKCHVLYKFIQGRGNALYTATNAIAHALHNIHSHYKYITSCRFYNSLEKSVQNTKMPYI